MKTTRKILLLSALIIISTVLILASCGDSNENNNNMNPSGIPDNENAAGTPGEENAAAEIPDNLPENDYGGYDFRLYMRDSEMIHMDFFIESEIGEVLNDAVYDRNKKIEERFNVNFKFAFYPYEEWSNATLMRLIRSGDDAFDIAAVHGTSVFALSGSDMLVDWYENMPFVDLTAPWWPDDINKNISSFGKLYGATGDITYTYLDFAGALLFNKELFMNLGMDYPYADVLNGAWTLDKFISIVKQGVADLNGDGVMTPEADRYGLEIRNFWHFPNEIFYSAGDRAISLTADGIPELTMYSQRTVDIYEKFFDMMNSGAAYINELSSPSNMFQDGRALFYNCALGLIIEYRALDFELGILPLPKYDENTPKYYTPVNQNTSMIIVPVTAANTERTSIITEALAAEGYRNIIPAYYEINLKTKHARDDESAAMLDFIRDGAICDYGVFDVTIMGELNNFGAVLAQTNASFTTMYERNRDAVERSIERLKERYGF